MLCKCAFIELHKASHRTQGKHKLKQKAGQILELYGRQKTLATRCEPEQCHSCVQSSVLLPPKLLPEIC